MSSRRFDVDGFFPISWDEWQRFKNDSGVRFHPATLGESCNKKLVKIWAPIGKSATRPYVVDNFGRKELIRYFEL